MKFAIAVVGTCAVLTVVGCSAKPSSEAVPTPLSSVSSSAGSGGSPRLPHSGAPAVADPLPESVLSDHPCEVLTPEQVRQALGPGASEGERRDLEQVGPGCGWGNPENAAAFQIGFSVVSREGLSAQYANTKPQKAVFRELASVAGFPAVAFKRSEDDNFCTVAVGIADEYSITAGVSQSLEKESDGTDSCVPAEKVAEVVVGNLKAKAGR
ncbi:DUF3558 domain-containing protein [Saccharomonospora xinjiangensis]|uniref:DUF3558 domain-containing protein n=1 Tax=Saccharomonospora xinjiangensis XJ-54 TaxID=882086 RepID=I0UYH2_9PSEU|nr:DUF3558 domain-containing protein [Saccharomonospora xinjiangensis]EID52925.1 Protein of unknown function (DUF3558) [Saccharomonospora xinjiangensis XJ-54]QBQ59782.1 hypothetical protein EYD13_07080 [Saccharomonospora xinjiangensis]